MRALQLILDPSLSDEDRMLNESDFNDTLTDPMDKDEEIQVDIYISNYKYNTTLQLFKKKISYRTLWCIISLPTKYTKESDPIRQTHYTTKRT